MHTHEVIVVYKLPSERAVCMLSMWQGLKAMNSWWPRNEVKRKLTSNDVAIGVNYGVASFSSWFQMWCSWGGFSLFTIVILPTPHERDQIAFISRTPSMKVMCTWSYHCHRMNTNKVSHIIDSPLRLVGNRLSHILEVISCAFLFFLWFSWSWGTVCVEVSPVGLY